MGLLAHMIVLALVSQQQCRRAPFCPHLLQHLLTSIIHVRAVALFLVSAFSILLPVETGPQSLLQGPSYASPLKKHRMQVLPRLQETEGPCFGVKLNVLCVWTFLAQL